MDDLSTVIPWPPSYKLKKHRRARRVKFRASRQHGLEITIPYRFSLRNLPAILEEHKPWIINQITKLQLNVKKELPNNFEFRAFDEMWLVRYVDGENKLKIIERPQREIVLLGGGKNQILKLKKLSQWVKLRAKEYLPLMLQQVSKDIQLPYASVKVRDQKMQWGSCTSDKTINLNYRLIFLPPALVRHIMVHELCHTVYLNHSAKFWSLVARHDSTWKENKRAMRQADQYVPQGI